MSDQRRGRSMIARKKDRTVIEPRLRDCLTASSKRSYTLRRNDISCCCVNNTVDCTAQGTVAISFDQHMKLKHREKDSAYNTNPAPS